MREPPAPPPRTCTASAAFRPDRRASTTASAAETLWIATSRLAATFILEPLPNFPTPSSALSQTVPPALRCRARQAGSGSYPTTLNPAFRRFAAMAEPMTPSPIIPTRRAAIGCSLAHPQHELAAQVAGLAHAMRVGRLG